MAVGGRESSSGGWLYGPGTDLLVGCGLASLAMLPLLGFAGSAVHALIPGALLVLCFSLPHYGATLVRVYEDAGDRRRYAFFAIYSSAALAALFVVGLNSVLVGSLILTLYLTWSPWHYTGQNYGIFLMMLGRRGVSVSVLNKRLIYASFVLCFAMTFLAIHGVERSGEYAPVSYDNTVYQLMPLGIPAAIATPLLWIVGVSYAISLLLALGMLLRTASFSAIAPSLLILCTQASWFSVPVLLRSWGAGPDNASLQSMYGAYGFLWIASAHAAQYLWITTYYATSADSAQRALPFLAKAAMAGFAIWTVPALIFAPGLLGRLPHESGLALMVAAMVNLHHFVLDGAIWKLRDGRLARILMPSISSAEAAPIEAVTSGRHLLRVALQGIGVACILYGLAMTYEEQIGFDRALEKGDIARARTAADRFAWLGRDGPTRRTQLGLRYASLGEPQPAEREFLRSIELQPSAIAWQSLARLREQQGDAERALVAYEEALRLEPDDPLLLYRSGMSQLEAGRADLAVPLLERAQFLAPGQSAIRVSLLRARRELREQGTLADEAPAAAPD